MDKLDTITSFDIDCSRYYSTTLAKLRNDHEHSDITLVVGPNRYAAHKLILGAASPVFRQMFHGKWKESKKKSVKLEETEECLDVFEQFLDFMYGCKEDTVSIHIDDVKPLLTLADKYQVDNLVNLLSKFMVTLIEGDVVRGLRWLAFAEQMQIGNVVDRCYDVICWNLKQASMCVSGEWEWLSIDQLLAIVKRGDVIVHSEYDIFMAVQEWCNFQNDPIETYDEGGKDLEKVVDCIEFGNMTTDELQKVQQSSLFKWVPSLAQPIGNAVAVRSFETEFCLAAKTKRKYLRTTGTKDIAFNKSTTDHTNSAMLSAIQNLKDKDGYPLKCDLNFEYKQSIDQKVFKIVGFRRESGSHYSFGGAMYNDRSINKANKSKTIRVVGIFLIRNKKTGIIHHLLQCNDVRECDNIGEGDSIVEFPGITCIDINQFKGNYLGQFEILYKTSVSTIV